VGIPDRFLGLSGGRLTNQLNNEMIDLSKVKQLKHRGIRNDDRYIRSNRNDH
jgi:hypothetical protein